MVYSDGNEEGKSDSLKNREKKPEREVAKNENQ
jgi:hypothetical protein